LIIGESFFIWKQNSHVVNFLNGDSRVVLKLFDKGKKMGGGGIVPQFLITIHWVILMGELFLPESCRIHNQFDSMLDTASRIELRTQLFQRKELNMSKDPIAISGQLSCINEHGVEINLVEILPSLHRR
jgi:hypothetical protein